jgi:hypothetical protein
VADSLDFTTSKKTDDDPGGAKQTTVPFTVDGVDYEARKPKNAMVAQLGPAMSRRSGPIVKVQLALDFLEDCIVEPGRSRLRERLMDENDHFDVEDALPILKAIAQRWKDIAELDRSGT